MSLKIALLSVLIILSSQFLIQQPDKIHLSASQPNLGFQNQTASGISSAQVSSFINYINSASAFYRDDTASKLKYISDQMNKTYGTSDFGYSVFQNPVGILDAYSLYIKDRKLAAVSGVDRIYPNNSYLFAIQNIYPTTTLVSLLNVGQRGDGMTDTLETAIKNIIASSEAHRNYCGCFNSDMVSMSNKLYQYDKGLWSFMCSQAPTIKASVLSKQTKAIYLKSKNGCHYIIWSS